MLVSARQRHESGKMVQMSLLAGQDGDADIEDRLGDTGVDEREGQTESNTETYTLPYGTSTANGDLLCDAGSSNWCSVKT